MDWGDVIRLANQGNLTPPRRVEKSREEWRELLGEEQFFVTRQAGTERPFSSEMCSLFQPGRYACSNCSTELFDSATKFESGTGWPSFSEPVADDVVAYHRDGSHGMVRIEAIPFQLNSLLDSIGRIFQRQAHDKGIELVIHQENQAPDILIGDPTRLTQMLVNMVGNAVKFTPHGRVDVFTRVINRQDENVVISFKIQDTGIGISADKLESIFDPFTQADNSITRRFGGTGLGLTIARELTEAHGGRLTFVDVEKGTRFDVSLPRQRRLL